MIKKSFVTLLLLLASFFIFSKILVAENIDTGQIQNQINEYTQKLNELGKSKDTLANQIKILDSQIQLNILKINQTENSVNTLEKDIDLLTAKINGLDSYLNQLSSAYIHQITQNYKLQKRVPLISLFLTSDLNMFLQQYKYVSMIQKSSQDSLINLETTRTNYDLQKQEKTKKQQELETLQKTLASQKNNLNNQKATKNNLLEVTKNDEKKYEQLLADAKQQLASFGSFITSQGGASLLNNQTLCNSWGCYYNQRDSQWGNYPIGLSSDSIAEYGCLITSTAMVASHYGKNIKPSDIAGSSNAFFGRTAYLLQGSFSVNDIHITRTRIGSSLSSIDSELNSNNPVIVGIRMNNGEHFVVIKSKENGKYIMNDPYVENGRDIPFTSKYSLSAIYKVDRVRVN
ncbi:MAG: C39 family peptidase [Candidatus Shapirobacteria bacterium]|nr:C39 family peptidase [Candidatus Shapirobacteria bacterium]